MYMCLFKLKVIKIYLYIVGDSSELRSSLANPHLRQLLGHLNSTHNPRGYIRLLMQEPLFLEFADVCFGVLHPELKEERQLSTEEVWNLQSCYYSWLYLSEWWKT